MAGRGGAGVQRPVPISRRVPALLLRGRGRRERKQEGDVQVEGGLASPEMHTSDAGGGRPASLRGAAVKAISDDIVHGENAMSRQAFSI